jgi:ABC-type phosphate transport system auxiliary subunit
LFLHCYQFIASVGVWFLHRSVINQLRNELKEQVDKELNSELENQTKALKLKIERLKYEFDSQLSQLNKYIAEAQQQREAVKQQLENLKNQVEDELLLLKSDAEKKMEQIFKEASEIIPLPPEELVKPEKPDGVTTEARTFA